MEKKNNINIAEILKDCPKGMKLYSPLYGEVEYQRINATDYPIVVMDRENNIRVFSKEGCFLTNLSDTECQIFLSYEMRDWTKFFKRGDVVRSIDDGTLAVFKGWESNDYTSFYASIVHHAKVDEWDEDIVFAVESFYKEPEEFARGFIVDAEEHYNGKYNPETLQVEPIKPECPFKPFDKVLVRNNDEMVWRADYFSHYKDNNDYHYCCIGNSYRDCIPFNDQTAHLLGTTDPYTEGGDK